MSSEPYIVHPGSVHGQVVPPPSKSQTQRFLNLVLLADRACRIGSPLISDDTRHFRGALEALRWTVLETDEAWTVVPPDRPVTAATIDCGASGTMLRFLVAALSARPGEWRLEGDERLAQRPVGPLVGSLRELGARIDGADGANSLPLEIHGTRLSGGVFRLDASESSQYLSALLMVAPLARGPVTVHVDGLTSAPYVDLTLEAMTLFGVEVQARRDGAFHLIPSDYRPRDVQVEGDYSSASYFAAAAALTRGHVEFVGLRRESKQGDAGFLKLLQEMGAEVDWSTRGVRVKGTGVLRAVDANLSRMPDQVPTLAAMAPFCEGVTHIRGVTHLRIKESDRLAAIARELRRLGAVLDEDEGELHIEGTWARTEPPGEPVRVKTWDDHRMAMSLALVGLRRPGVGIDRPEVVAKSYPDFWNQLEGLIR